MAPLARRALAWTLTAAGLLAFWLLLVDTHEEAQILVGVGVAVLAASVTELVRRQRIAEVRMDPRWLVRLWRPVVSVPGDLLRLAAAVVPGRHPGGRLRALPFDPHLADSTDNGRLALAELAGSFSPNTIVVGVDVERGVLLAHQLVPEEERPERSVDPLDLGRRGRA